MKSTRNNKSKLDGENKHPCGGKIRTPNQAASFYPKPNTSRQRNFIKNQGNQDFD